MTFLEWMKIASVIDKLSLRFMLFFVLLLILHVVYLSKEINAGF